MFTELDTKCQTRLYFIILLIHIRQSFTSPRLFGILNYIIIVSDLKPDFVNYYLYI